MVADWSVRRLTAEDWQRYRAVRLAMLLDEPAAYGSSFAREVAYDEQRWRSLLEQAVFLAESGDGLHAQARDGHGRRPTRDARRGPRTTGSQRGASRS